jgi:hypothetical protein
VFLFDVWNKFPCGQFSWTYVHSVLGLELPLLAVEVNELYGLFCCMWGYYTFICSKVTVRRGRICCVCVCVCVWRNRLLVYNTVIRHMFSSIMWTSTTILYCTLLQQNLSYLKFNNNFISFFIQFEQPFYILLFPYREK